MGAAGAVCNFMPDDIAAAMGLTGLPAGTFLVQLLAGLLLALAVTNWMCRSLRVGGIYGRPLALGNALNFVVAAFAFGRIGDGVLPATIGWALFAVTLVHAIGFVWVVFAAPAPGRAADHAASAGIGQ
jgi:hypothetical protein